MSTYIPEMLRIEVVKRANHVREYCLFAQEDSFYSFQIDHIISLKHGGGTNLENLALSCMFCNRNKGSDIGSFVDNQRRLFPFFNPRMDKWNDHFKLLAPEILPTSNIGIVTVKILDFNADERVKERLELMAFGGFPHPNARQFYDG